MAEVDNPFTEIGYPKELLERMVKEGDAEAIAAYAVGALRLIARHTHPDIAGPYSDLFPHYAEAVQEIEDAPLDAAEYWLGSAAVLRGLGKLKTVTNEIIKDDNKDRLVSSLLKVDSRLVVPWMEGRELIYGIGATQNPSGVVLVRYEDGGEPRVYSIPSKGGAASETVKYDEERGIWVMTTSYISAKTLDANDEAPKYKEIKLSAPNTPEELMIVGGVREQDYTEVYKIMDGSIGAVHDSKALGSHTSYNNISIKALTWSSFDNSWWSKYFVSEAGPQDALVLAKSVDGQQPIFAITAPPFAGRLFK